MCNARGVPWLRSRPSVARSSDVIATSSDAAVTFMRYDAKIRKNRHNRIVDNPR